MPVINELIIELINELINVLWVLCVVFLWYIANLPHVSQ